MDKESSRELRTALSLSSHYAMLAKEQASKIPAILGDMYLIEKKYIDNIIARVRLGELTSADAFQRVTRLPFRRYNVVTHVSDQDEDEIEEYTFQVETRTMKEASDKVIKNIQSGQFKTPRHLTFIDIVSVYLD